MKSQNHYRDLSAEQLISSAHGPLHAIIPEGVKPEKKTGPVPYGDPDEARVCLECPLRECLLDSPSGICRRFEKEMRKVRRQRHDETGEAR